MRRTTHIAAGAAIALPFTLELSAPASAGAVFLGMAGAVFPDYLDIRSEARRVLRHRGISHSLLFAALVTGIVYVFLKALARADDQSVRLSADLVSVYTIAFGAGLLSHLALDACTAGGIRPFLPLIRRRVWLLPRSLRARSPGWADSLVRRAASICLIAGLLYTAVRRW